jgi:hypothetical protein
MRHRAGRGLQLTRKDLEKGGLSRAVRADYAIAASVCELDIDIFEQGFSSQSECNVIDTDHVFSSSSFSYKPIVYN